ncbi:MAG: biotin--[acetyl-CoA-carboxylase] ligase [Proteobacteria bacterium]|nr:biotin--[acetyl-CoA-carboxylase] ligase [Pseudomonadota bacterium]MBU1688397.1 biotin--[acetyl-CoA-carboxylase] ligase [Pseudomonadota bacterium]
MGIIHADHALLHRLIREDEVLLRSSDFPADTIEAVFRTGAMIGSAIHHHPSLSRGMDHARILIEDYEQRGASFPSGLVIIADTMTGGKGRFQRAWHAPVGGLWLTVVLVNTLLPASTMLYPLAVGVAAAEAVIPILPQARLKWVNDLHVHGEKVGGILVETLRGRRSGEEYVLLGLGINVNNTEFPGELTGLAVSIRTLSGQEIDLSSLLLSFLAKLTWNIGLLHVEEANLLEAEGASGGVDPDILALGIGGRTHHLVKRYRSLCDSVGRRVLYGHDVQNKPLFSAGVRSIDGAGRLVLTLGDGSIITENSGEISYIDPIKE